MHRRRLLLSLPLAAALLTPAAETLAQTAAPDGSPPAPDGSAVPRAGAPRPKFFELNYEQMRPRQRQRVQQILGAPGAPPASAEEARRQWDGMSQAQRRQAIRRAQATQRQQRGQPPGTGSATE
jgi:hypothetical protein